MATTNVKFWVATAASLINTILLLFVIFGIMLALAVIAPVISSWPLFVLLATGLTFSIAALRIGKDIKSRGVRLSGYLINGSALALCLCVTTVIAVLVASSVEERYIIPDGFQGNVYVIHGAKNGAPEEKSFWGYTYRIPSGGILATQTPAVSRWTRSKYYYKLPTGELRLIENFWPTTIPDTAENRANTHDQGVYFPRSGSFGNSSQCRYDEFYVGTKSGVLTDFKEADLGGYIREHGIECGRIQ